MTDDVYCTPATRKSLYMTSFPPAAAPALHSGSGVRLSVLDTAMIATTPAQALQDSVRLAQTAEELGFTRYWMAEHHGVRGVASSAPVVTVGAIAAASSRIRVGSGGVMLPNHVPLVVAEQFGTLASLYPDRIDLGVGRATPDPRTASVLVRYLTGYGADDFPDRVAQLVGWLYGKFPAPHPFQNVPVSPHAPQPASIWVLGSSSAGAELAAALGVPFAFAYHFGIGDAATAIDHYRTLFRRSGWLAEPYTMVTLLTAVADTDEEAARIAAPADLLFRNLSAGRQILLPTPEEAAAHDWSDTDIAFAQRRRQGQAVGSAETFAQVANDLVARTGADELMLTAQISGFENRVRSLELAADALIPGVRAAAEH